jgi:hypothetical protein
MDYDKMTALMETSCKKSARQGEPEPKEPQATFYAGLEISRRTDGSLGETAVMTTPTIFQWFRILRQHYRFTVFQAVRGALWLGS